MRRTTPVLILLMGILTAADVAPVRAQITPQVSANGLLAFRSDRDGDAEIFTMSATGEGPVNLTDNEGISDLQPAWSPDGQRIAFVRRRPETARPDLFVMNADGSAPDQLTTQGIGSADRSPAWSPDGARIAFVSDRDGGFPELYLMNADGSGVRRITVNSFVDGNPTWSPDGLTIAVERCCPNGSSEIYAIDVATRVEVNLTNSPSQMDFDPSWSPDATTIAFVSFVVGEGNVDIWSMNADGSSPVRLTTDVAV